MIYLIDKDFWKNGKETEVRTEIGDIALRFEQSSSVFNRRIIIYDRYHVEIGQLKRKGLSNFSHDIYYDGQVIGSIIKKRVLFSKRLVIKSMKGEEFRIKGSMKDYTIDIYRRLKRVARAHPKLSANDNAKYGFECIDDENRYLLLCAVVAMGIA